MNPVPSMNLLTRNFIVSMTRDSETNKMLIKPTVEVLHINNICNRTNTKPQHSYCLVISDGTSRAPVFIAEELNYLIQSGSIRKGSFVKLIDYEPFISNHLKTIRVIKMEVLLIENLNATISNAAENRTPFNDGNMIGVTVPCQSVSPLLNSASTGQATLMAMIPKSNGVMSIEPIAAQSILTTGAISMIAKGEKDKNFIVQVIYTFQSTEDIHLMFVSDGLHMQIAMLAPPLNHLIISGQLKKGTVVQLLEYICPTVHNGMKMIVINMEVRIMEYEVIGEPKLYVEAIPRLGDAKDDLTNETSFFMHQPRLTFRSHRQTQDVYLPNKNNTAIRGDVMPMGQPNRNFEVASLMEEVERHQFEVNRLHLEMKSKQEKHEVEVSRLKSEMIRQRKRSENQIKAMKKELEPGKKKELEAGKKKELEALQKKKKKVAGQENEDLDSKTDAELESSEAKFEVLDEELERIWL